MSNLIPMGGNSQSSEKKWYQKPENLTSAIFLIVIGYIGYKFGAGLLAGILNLAGFIGVAAVLAVLIGVFLTQRRAISGLWGVSMYKLTNAIYRIDPIAIAFQKLKSLEQKAEQINKAVINISGELKKVTTQIEQNKKEIITKTDQIKALSKQNRPREMEMKLLAKDITRFESWNEDLLPLQNTMTTMQFGIKKLYEAANFVIADKKSDLAILQKRYESVKIGWAAVRNAQSIYGKNSNDRQEIETLIGLADEDMNNKLAEMDNFMEMAAPVFTEVDIQNSINDTKMQEMINRITGGELDKVIEKIQTPMSLEAKKKESIKETITPEKEPVKLPASTHSNSSNGDYDVMN